MREVHGLRIPKTKFVGCVKRTTLFVNGAFHAPYGIYDLMLP